MALPLLKSTRPKITAEHATPARSDLALAIGERNAAADKLARIQDATGWLMSAPRRAAEQQVEAAETALGAAAVAAGATIAANVASGEDSGPPAPLIEARATLAAARDTLAAAKVAEEQLAEQLPAAKDALRKAEWRVKQAAAAVMRGHPTLGGIVARVEKMQRELCAVGGVMEALISANVLATCDDGGHRLRTVESAAYEKASERMSFIDNWDFHGEYRQGVPFGRLPQDRGGGLKQIAAAPWLAALEALQRDAAAPLPEMAK